MSSNYQLTTKQLLQNN